MEEWKNPGKTREYRHAYRCYCVWAIICSCNCSIVIMDRNKMLSLLEQMAEALDNRATLSEFEAEWLEQVQTQNSD